MKTTILPIFAIALFFGCAKKNNENPAELPGQSNAQAVPVGKNDSIPFPVYLSFEEFEPYLRRSGDTTYVLNFWATWCGPCVKELPFFEKLMADTKGKPVQVLLVSMDFPKDIGRKLVPFVAQRSLEKSVVALADMDYNAWIDQVSTDWDGAIPFTLVYNKTSRKVKLGELDSYEDLVEFVGHK